MTANDWTNKPHHWPKMKGGHYATDSRKLPLHVWAISKFLADPSHHDKSFACALYKLEKKSSRELKFMPVNCKHQKETSAYGSSKTRNTYDLLKARYHAIWDHHFSDHSCCHSKGEGW